MQRGPPTGARWQEASYHQADGKLAVFERHMGDGSMEAGGNSLTGRGLLEEYRYDALGRRVLVWARRGADCTDTGCESTVRRAIWAGEQLVYETRGPGADSVHSHDLEHEAPSGDGDRGSPKAYGVVGYAHAGGIDHPLVVHRASTNTTFFPHTNWRGLYDGATNPAGELIPCYGSNPAPCANVPDIDWPGSETSVFIGATPTSRTTPAEWAGSLVTEQADASGLLYRRNRYYDPASGRFTQPDPIGLAGGLNAYGFANGDPVNYSDPFGLKPIAGGVAAARVACSTSVGAPVCAAAAAKAGQAIARSPGAQRAMQLGAEGERRVRDAINLAKNSKAVKEMRGRIPDFVDKASKAYHEVKNVAKQSYTQQLRDMQKGAEELQSTLTIWLRDPEKISGPLRRAAEEGKVILEKIP